MSIALDYTSRIDPAALKAAGVSDVCRYLSWPNYWGGQTHTYQNPKIIRKTEYDELVRAGIGVTLNWEYDSRDWLGGADAGKAHGIEAVRQAKALGYPAGCVIVGSADFDMTGTQWENAGRAYGKAFAAELKAGGYRAGVYGPYDVLAWCARDLSLDITAFWQAGMSWAWSGGRNRQRWPGAHLRQMGHKTVGGTDTDWNEILIPDWGQTTTKGLPMGEQLLNGWPVPADPDGKPDNRGAGVWAADTRAYIWTGVDTIYHAEPKHGDPAGPASGVYLDRLLKTEIRDPLRKLADQAGQVVLQVTDEQLQAAIEKALPAALEAALAKLTVRVET